MSDGRIVYEVRVDGSKIAGDLSAAAEQINAGTASLVMIGEKAAKNLGNAMTKAFGKVSSGIDKTLSKLSSGFSDLGIKAEESALGVSPLVEQLNAIEKLDYERIAGLIEKFGERGMAIVSPVASAGATKLLSENTKNSYRSGKDFIQKDELAFLHKGEAVLTAAENETLRALGGVEGATASVKCPLPIPVREAAVQTQPSQLHPQEINLTVELDGYKVAKAVSAANSEIERQLNAKLTR